MVNVDVRSSCIPLSSVPWEVWSNPQSELPASGNHLQSQAFDHGSQKGSRGHSYNVHAPGKLFNQTGN